MRTTPTPSLDGLLALVFVVALGVVTALAMCEALFVCDAGWLPCEEP